VHLTSALFPFSIKSSVVPSVVSLKGGDVRLILNGKELNSLVDDELKVTFGTQTCTVSESKQFDSIFSVIVSIPPLISSDLSNPIVTVKTSFDLILSSIQIFVEPPLIARGKLQDGGVSVRISFSHATNKADARTDETNCQTYFNEESYLSLGKFPTCIWSNDSEMVILLGLFPSLQAGDFLQFNADSHIMSASKVSSLADTLVALERSEMYVITVASIIGPGSIGFCDAAVYTVMTQPSAFVQTYAWSSSDSLLDSCLLKEYSATVNVPRRCLASIGTFFTLQVTLRMFDGNVLFAEKRLYSSPIDVPILQIQAPKIMFYVSENLRFASDLRYSACNDSASTVSFYWRLSRLSGEPLSGSVFEQNGALFIISSLTLKPDKYRLQLRASSQEWTALSSVDFTVRSSPLIATITGGNRFVSPLDVALDASKSRDPDNDKNRLDFIWSCTSLPLQIPCTFVDGQIVYFDREPKPRLTSAMPEGRFIITLQIRLQPYDGRQAFAQVTLTIMETKHPIRLSYYESTKANLGSGLMLNIGQQLLLQATDDLSGAPAQARWSTDVPSLEISNIASSTLGTVGSMILLTGKGLLGIFEFTVIARTAYAEASITVTINSPPEGGNCIVLPTIGSENEIFLSTCNGVVDADFPIKYKLRCLNVETRLLTELSSSISGVRRFMLPPGTFLVTHIACDAYDSCSDITSTSVVVRSSENTGVSQLNHLRDAALRNDVTELLDAFKLLSPSLNALTGVSRKSKLSGRRLLQTSNEELLSTLFQFISNTVLDNDIASEIIKVLQILHIDSAALASFETSATISALDKLARASSGWVAHSTIAAYLVSIFDHASSRFIYRILSTMQTSITRSATDVVPGVPIEYRGGQRAAWQMGAVSTTGVALVNATISFPWKSDSSLILRPEIFISHYIDKFVIPSDPIIIQTNTFPMPWRNSRGPWVTPAVSMSLISRQSGSILLNHIPASKNPLFTISLPLSLAKVSAMNQRVEIVKKKLTPKIWNDVISAWLSVGCRLLDADQSQCNITCDRLGLVAVEFDLTLFACGDGVRNVDEQCDDWNERNDDGCDSLCRVEAGWECQLGQFPAEKYGFDKCKRLPCYPPYDCSGMGVCTSLNTCACDVGYFGNGCNISLKVISKAQLNFSSLQLPQRLELTSQSSIDFSLMILKVANASNETIEAKVFAYDPQSFPSIPPDPVDAPLPNKTISVPSETVFLSNVFDVRINSQLQFPANTSLVLARKVALSRRTNGSTINFAIDDPNSNVTWRVMKLVPGSSSWQPVAGATLSSASISKIAIAFSYSGNAYYAVFAMLPPVYREIQQDLPTSVEISSLSSPTDHTAAIVGGALGALFLFGAIAYGIRKCRRKRKQAVVAMYYRAVSRSKGKRRVAQPKAMTPVRDPHLERPAPEDLKSRFNERPSSQELPPLPVTSVESPPRARPSIWKAVNRLNSSPSVIPGASLLEKPQPPPAVGSGSQSQGSSLVAAAIRSKMLRQSPSIRKSKVNLSSDQTFDSNLSPAVDSVVSEASQDQVFKEPDEIEVRSVADEGENFKELVYSRNETSHHSSANDEQHFEPIFGVDSLSEGSTIWRTHEQVSARSFDLDSTTVSAASVSLSVFSTYTEEDVASASQDLNSTFRGEDIRSES
jgi:cysteine-rich repeat protein